MAHQGRVHARALASKNVNSNVFQKNYKKVERNTEMGKSNVEHFTNGFSKNNNNNNIQNLNKGMTRQNKEGFGGSYNYNEGNTTFSQLLGRNILSDEFKKNDMGISNMVPFFKKSGFSADASDKLFQRKLEMQTGGNKYDKQKKESKPLFKPTIGLTNIYGQQLDEKFSLNKDRYAIGKNRTNELPFEKEYIQPFEGYNNDFLRDIEEIDAKTKLNSSVKHMRGEANVSFEGREGPPSAMNKKRGELGEVYKHRPDKFSTLDARPPVKSSGIEKPMKHPDCTIVPKTKRGKFSNLFGIAKSAYDKETERPLIRKSSKVTYKKDSIRNVTASGMWNAEKDPFDYDKNSYSLPATEGEAYTGKTQLLNVDSAFKALIAPFSDIAKTTIKETNIHNDREGNFNGPTKLTVHPDDVLKTTIKETNIHNDREGNMNSNHPKHTAYDPNDVLRTTIKETNIHNERDGNMSSYHTKHTAYDPNDVAKTTIKETNIDNDREGNVGRLENSGKGYLTNPQYAPPTNKETTSDMDYYGTAGAYDDRPKSYAADYNMRQNTMKEPLEIGRDPTPQGVKVANGSDTVNLDINKLDSDYINIREVAQTKIYPSLPTEVSCQVTSDKSTLDNNKIANRIGGNLLEAFKKNPYTQPLDSFAYN